jgi:hypothetical protein
MPATAPDSVERIDFGPIDVGSVELGGYTTDFLHIKGSIDMRLMLRGLPGDRCPCPHWGIVTEGGMTVRYDDHDEVISAGDVFYMVPGHVPEYLPGTRLIQFSPTAEMQVVTETIMRNQQQLQGS